MKDDSRLEKLIQPLMELLTIADSQEEALCRVKLELNNAKEQKEELDRKYKELHKKYEELDKKYRELISKLT